MNINKWVGVGRLADDVRYTEANGTVSSKAIGRLIVNRPPGRDGQRRYDAIPFVAWGSYADNLAKYTSRGKELGIEGALHVNTSQDPQSGKWNTYVEIQVKDVQFGRDSTTTKVMKASIEGNAAPAAGVQTYLEELLKNPENRKKIAAVALAQGLGTTTPTKVVKKETVEEEAPSPFLET